MRRTLSFAYLSVALALTACVRSQAASAPQPPAPAPATVAALPAGTTVILARHAERLDQTTDPPLNEVGMARAEALAQVLDTVRVDVVITTQLQRTRLTAAPFMTKRGLEPVVVATGPLEQHVATVASLIRERYAGKTVLVVGHSNTIPAVARALGATSARPLADTEHGDLYIVRSDGAHVTLTMGRFGQ